MDDSLASDSLKRSFVYDDVFQSVHFINKYLPSAAIPFIHTLGKPLKVISAVENATEYIINRLSGEI